MTEEGSRIAGAWGGMWRQLQSPLDISALVAFRVAFGLLVATSALRFLVYGWIEIFFTEPRFHFTYWGLGWVKALPGYGMHAVFAGLLVLGLCVAAGLYYRLAMVCLFLAFTYVQAVDVTTYLNHYYLVSLLAGLMIFVPAHRACSLDVWLKRVPFSSQLPAGFTYLLRFQVAVVYVYAGLAKLSSDWLLHAQPLSLWLLARTGLPWIGPALSQNGVAWAAAWSGFLFDTTIVAFLLWKRTRAVAYAVVLFFHAGTYVLFPIGMFPFIMVTAALVFFDPSWPRRFLRLAPFVPTPVTVSSPSPQDRLALGVVGLYALVQVALPLRTHLYGGNVLWHEQGMRFSWRVMAREKNGSVTFLVKDPSTQREWHVTPSRYLTRVQEREMSVQPDLILQLAHHIAQDFAARGHPGVEVRADARASLNGRPAALLVDPTVDLALEEEGLGAKRWIYPAPKTPPLSVPPKGPRSASWP